VSLRPVARASFALLVLLSTLPAQAATWRGVEPGVSARAAVLKQFGEPSKVIHHKTEDLVGYFASHVIKGTRQVIFRIDTATDVVHRIDVFPATTMTRGLVENTYGPPCAAKASDGACYVVKLQDTQTYLHYASQGLAVFLKSDGRTVFSFVYLPPVVPAPAGTTETAQAQPQDTSSHAEDAIESVDATPPPAETSSFSGGLDTSSLNEDPLKIGGLVYLRGDVAFSRVNALKVDTVSVPSLIDAYFDGRPTDRLRAMVLARLTFDPALSANPTVAPVGGALIPAPNNPNVQLDQLWLNFDVQHLAFVTIGRQHVKWGTGRFWNPTDFLTPVRTDPLSTFDTRLGTDMLKISIPWESTSSSFTVAGLLDSNGPDDAPLEVGAAFRAETVLLGAEVGVDAVFRQHHRPEYGLSLSSALGPFDVTGEVALRREMDYPLWRRIDGVGTSAAYDQQFEAYLPSSYVPQVSAGLNYRWKLTEERSLTFGAEGFYNALGQDEAEILPWLMYQGAYLPFYTGRYYAAAFASFDSSSLLRSTSVTLTGLTNLSDHSYLARLDVSTQVMTALNVELFASAPFLVQLANQVAVGVRNAKLIDELNIVRASLEDLLEHANALILVANRDRKIRVFNQRLAAITGYPKDEVLGEDLLRFIPETERLRLLRVISASLKGEQVSNFETRILTRNGHEAKVAVSTSAVLDNQGEIEGVIAVGQDVTALRELEKRFVQAEKLASLGKLAASVVHEINNPMTAVATYADALLMRARTLPGTEAEQEKLKRIVENSDRILRFTRDLVTYSRPAQDLPAPLDLNEAVEVAVRFCEHVVRETGARVVRKLSPLPKVPGVRGNLVQVFVNLITNACHAMTEGGQVTVATRTEGEDAVVILSDTGEGIEPSHLEQIFEPFFTTKAEGRGTGLGLSIVQGIIEKHGGQVRVESEVGRGTTFTIRLPLGERHPASR
jgi:PAS domain S-box-containing protein